MVQVKLFQCAYDLLVEIATDLTGIAGNSSGCVKCAANITLSKYGPQATGLVAAANAVIDLQLEKKPYMGDEALGAWIDTCGHEPREVYEYAARNLCRVHAAAPVSEMQVIFDWGTR